MRGLIGRPVAGVLVQPPRQPVFADRWCMGRRALTAGCAVAAAVLSVTLSSCSDLPTRPGAPVTVPTTPTPSAPTSPTTLPSAGTRLAATPTTSVLSSRPVSPAFPGVPVIWGRQLVSDAMQPLGPLAFGDTLVYAYELIARDRERLLAIDPDTGIAVASAVVRLAPSHPDTAPVVVAAGRVWTWQPRSAALQWRDPHTLAVRGTIALNGGGPVTDIAMHGTLIYIGQPRRVMVIDAATAQLVHQFPIAASGANQSTRLSVSPNGSRLYLGSNNSSRGEWSLTVLDTESGAVLAGPVRPGGTAVTALLATDGGVFATQTYGMSADVRFFTTQALAAGGSVLGHQVETGAGTLPLGTWLVNGAVYTTSPNEVACRDPHTARVRAAQATHQRQYYTGFGQVGGHLLALWQPITINTSGQVYLVRLTPPTVCRSTRHG